MHYCAGATSFPEFQSAMNLEGTIPSIDVATYWALNENFPVSVENTLKCVPAFVFSFCCHMYYIFYMSIYAYESNIFW